MCCPRCGSDDVLVLPTEIPGEPDFEQYHCNSCMYDWNTDDEELGKLF